MKWETDNQSIQQFGELFHYGILGQKWGVRRFQNENGSLTPAGKKRYSKIYYNGKTLYGELRKEEDVEKEVSERIDSSSDEIRRIRTLSDRIKKVQNERNKAFQDYYSKLSLDDKQKKDIEKVLDSWYGKSLNKDQKKDYDYEVQELIYNTINPFDAYGNTPKHIRKVESEYIDRSNEYWNEVDDFKKRLINDYSDTIVYTTKKGFLGINIFDKVTEGERFIKDLIYTSNNKFNLAEKLGEYEKRGNYTHLIGLHKYETERKADKALNDAVKRLAKEFSFDWYNKQKSKTI